ncbi:hypothetical protein HAX54_014011 [Datura stramonium]|uniref:Protein kinase domain-containing protein n=1 Tax=Datura stramonium TaxID=4076 RepID=A0ABS8Y4N3_DATST|nr:hypothetical protein [Datura stramonium]
MKPKISDFGIARLFQKDEKEANTGKLFRTYGCVPPEYVNQGIYSRKYDVLQFGVLLLQILGGKKNSCVYGIENNLNLLEYAYELWQKGNGVDFIDILLQDDSQIGKQLRCMQVALLCVKKNGRPMHPCWRYTPCSKVRALKSCQILKFLPFPRIKTIPHKRL